MSGPYYDMEFHQELRSSDLLDMIPIIDPLDETLDLLEAHETNAQDANISSTVSNGFSSTSGPQDLLQIEDSKNFQRVLATGTLPSVDEFGGAFGFDICRETLTKVKAHNSWTYSEPLHQVFIKANSNLSVRFKLGKPLDNKQYFIRALLVFQCNDYLSEAVKRCTIHWMEDDPSQLAHKSLPICDCVQYNLAGHVLRSQAPGAVYDFNAVSGRHSVLIVVPSPEELHRGDFLSGHFFFACNTSCPSGMQRRQVQIIFTFEDQDGQVCGRRVLPVKICHCPKRDKDRLEKGLKLAEKSEPLSTKRPFQAVTIPVKKIKTESLADGTAGEMEALLAESVQQQEKDLEAAAALVSSMLQRHREMADLLKQLVRPSSSNR